MSKKKRKKVFSPCPLVSVSEYKTPHFVTAWLYLADLLHKAILVRNVFVRWGNDCIPDGTKSPLRTAPLANNSSENMSGYMSHLVLEGLNQFSVETWARCSYLDKTGGMLFFFLFYSAEQENKEMFEKRGMVLPKKTCFFSSLSSQLRCKQQDLHQGPLLF